MSVLAVTIKWGLPPTVLALMVVVGVLGWRLLTSNTAAMGPLEKTKMKLAAPSRDGEISVEAALQRRRSVRKFDGTAISLAHLGQLPWAAQRQTSASGYRTAPSAGALYPLKAYAVVGKVP